MRFRAGVVSQHTFPVLCVRLCCEMLWGIMTNAMGHHDKTPHTSLLPEGGWQEWWGRACTKHGLCGL